MIPVRFVALLKILWFMEDDMKIEMVEVPKDLTYIGAFITFRCGYSCPYCITRHGELRPREEMTTVQWIEGLNRLSVPKELMVPITLQGGEPSKWPSFIELVNGLSGRFYVDILTNLDFDVDDFMCRVRPERLQRDVPYASIRVSYHPESDIDELLGKVLRMQSRGYSIGVFAVNHPDLDLSCIREMSERMGIDFRTKEFLGWHKGKLHGNYKYPDAVDGKARDVECRMTEILIAPNGDLHKCHRDLYAGEYPLGNLLDDGLKVEFKFRGCGKYGGKYGCNPCDVKLKNNRFQEWGTCSVDIREPFDFR